MDTKYGVHFTSSDVVREAKEFLLHTTRPETPRHNHEGSRGDNEPVNITKIDMGERRSLSRSVRLNPIGPEPITVPTRQSRTQRPRGSAETRLESTISQMESAEIKFPLCADFCRIMKTNPQISQSQQERVLNACAVMLNQPKKCDVPQRIAVSSVMVLLELGPINLSVLGSNLFKISSDAAQFFAHPPLVDGLINELDSADELLLLTLNKLIVADLHGFVRAVKKKRLNVLGQIRRGMARIITESQNASPAELKSFEKRMVLLLEASRQLVNVTELFAQVEQDGQFVAIWLHCIQTFIESEHVIHLCARLLSISTQSSEFCAALQCKGAGLPAGFSCDTSERNWMLFVAQAIERHMKQAHIVVRFLYAIGNGAAACKQCRHDKFVKTTRRVLAYYVKRGTGGNPPFFANSDLDLDVVLKAVRVCANFALEESGANSIVAEDALIKLHIKLFQMILDEKAKFKETDELLKYIIAALNNIIYFSSIDFEKFASDVASLFIKCLMGENMIIIAESCRALGNLSRYSSVREQFTAHQADKLLIALLDSPDANIVQHVVGILINFTLGSDCSSLFLADSDAGLRKLLAAMTEFGDWHLATLIVQLLWNVLRYGTMVVSGERKHSIVQSITAVSSLFPEPTDAAEAHKQRSFFELSEKFQEQMMRI